MANTINFILTNAALELIPKIINGKTLTFTRMAVGDGFSYDENVAKGFTTLVNEVLNLEITKKEIENSSTVKITSAFTSADVQKEFYYREVGLFALDPDTGNEILYAYGNRNDAAELITPNGSSSVAKRLIFSVSVGNSANVIVNINSDIYDKADKNLANTGMITNCLLEVPQRIKYELANGYLTIKAGSVVIVPYGTVDLSATYPVGANFLHSNFKVISTQYNNNGKFFIWVELQEDLIHTNQGVLTESCMEFILPEMNWATDWGLESILSGETPPTGNRFFYNTQTNYVEWYDDNEITHFGFSLPVMVTNKENGIPTSIKQVFNGMGYIGSIIWVDKGVKGLIPNGRNADGTLNNIEYTTTNITFVNCSDKDYTNINFYINSTGKVERNYLHESETIVNDSAGKTYVPSRNQIVYIDGEIYKECYIAKGTISGGKITSLKPYTTFKPVDYNNYEQKIKELETRLSLLEAKQNI